MTAGTRTRRPALWSRARRRAVLGIAALGCAVGAWVLVYTLAPASSPPEEASGAVGQGLAVAATGRPAPSFTLPRLGGGPPVSLAAEHDHPVIINFFASWCAECRAELHAFAQASSHAGDVRFIGIDVEDSTPRTAEKLLRSAGVHYPVGTDSSASTANGSYLIEALPATVFVATDGRIAGHAYGAQTVASLDHWIARLSAGRSEHA